MKRFLALIGVILLSFDFLYSQKITGGVLDNKHTPIELATVRLLNTDSTFVQGTHTDSLGRYSMDVEKEGDYLLYISCVGYDSCICPIYSQKDTNIPTIILLPQDTHLSEVTVEASSFIRYNDRMVIFPDKEQKKFSRTGYDVLYRLMIPEVSIDRINKKVSVIGGDVTIYIDGNKAESREIQGLNPNEIEKVEFYDVPTGKYMNDIASINFITKQYTSGGYFSLSGEQKLGYLQGNYEGTAKFVNKTTSYTLFAGYSISKYDGPFNDLNETFIFSDHQTKRNSNTLENKINNNNQYFQLNITDRASKRSLSGKLFLVHAKSPNNYAINKLEYLNEKMRQVSTTRTDQNNWKSGVELYGSFQLSDRQQLNGTVRAEYTNNSYGYGYLENNYSIRSNSKENLYELAAVVNYDIQLKHENSFAVQAYHFQTISSITNSGDNPYWKHFWEGESLLFLEYNQKINNAISLRVGPGLSFIQYHLHGDTKKKKISPRLHFNMMFLPSKKQQIRIGCPVGSGYLQLDQLNEVEQKIDSLQVRRGNPDQKIAFQTTPSIAYSGVLGRLNIAANISYNIINNVLAENFFIENNQLVRSYDNGTKFRMFFSQLATALKVTDNFRVKFAGRWQYTKYKSTIEQLHWLSGDMQIDYYYKNFSCGVFLQSKNKWIDFNLVHWTSPAKYGGYINWSHKNWYAECGVSNPFIKHTAQTSVLDRNIYSYTNVIENRLNKSYGYIKLTYTLDFGKKVNKDRADVNSTINSAILKAN